MKFFAKRPTLFLWVLVLAMFLAKANHGRGFHQW
jgi:hypothetical protein